MRAFVSFDSIFFGGDGVVVRVRVVANKANTRAHSLLDA